MIRLPPLPTPTIIDGRSLFTAADMRAYGLACLPLFDEHDAKLPESKPSTIENPFGSIFGSIFDAKK